MSYLETRRTINCKRRGGIEEASKVSNSTHLNSKIFFNVMCFSRCDEVSNGDKQMTSCMYLNVEFKSRWPRVVIVKAGGSDASDSMKQ